jgi:hypothetical protein
MHINVYLSPHRALKSEKTSDCFRPYKAVPDTVSLSNYMSTLNVTYTSYFVRKS